MHTTRENNIFLQNFWATNVTLFRTKIPQELPKFQSIDYLWNIVGRMVHIPRWVSIHIHFFPSCVCKVYFLLKFTEFHDMRTECQKILFHFLLLIYHKSPDISKRCPLPYPLPIFAPRSLFLSLSLLSWSTFIGGADLHKQDSVEMMLVVVHIQERGYMMMVVVVPNQVLTSRTK